jgi:hypothetical protein
MKDSILPVNERKKILLLSDDLRMPSGIGTMSREIVLGTCHRFNWVQLAAAIQHPEVGKVLDAGQSLSQDTGVPDAYLHIIPCNGYGDANILRQIIKLEKPDAILHFTDPRYWIWLYQMEHEIRETMPITYYSVWDDLPYPKYNRDYYRSSDSLFAISKQTHNIHKQVLGEYGKEKMIRYVPHGINQNHFYKCGSEEDLKGIEALRQKLFKGNDFEFVVLYNNRNIRRKMTGDVILAFREFVKKLNESGNVKDAGNKCVLVLHTQPVDENGTDLPRLINDIAPDINVVFSAERTDTKTMNHLYNLSDVTINLASNEGFGLSTAESIMAETIIIANVTGGLQDQMGFRNDEGNYLDADADYCEEWGSNSDGRFKQHGEWAIPLFPTSRALIGSPPTPYIFDDRCRWEDAAEALLEVHSWSKEERQRRGALGREYMLTEGFNAEEMCHQFVANIEETLGTWTPRQAFELVKV